MSDSGSGGGKTIHMVPRSDGWEVYREGNKKAQAVHQSKELAYKHAQKMAHNDGVEVRVHESPKEE